MVRENGLFDAFELCVLYGQELVEGEKAWFVFGLIVVAVLDLALQGSKLDGLLTGAWMGAVHNGILGLWGGGEIIKH